MNSRKKRRCDEPASEGLPWDKANSLSVALEVETSTQKLWGHMHFSSSPKTACLNQNGQPHKAVSSPSLKVFKQKLSRNMVRNLERRFYTW